MWGSVIAAAALTILPEALRQFSNYRMLVYAIVLILSLIHISIFRYLYADTQKELTTKLRQNIDAYQGVELTEQSKMTLAQWLDRWSTVYMTGVVRPNTCLLYTSRCV